MAPPAVLSIAGSDSGGGAGIQADLKAFARCGVHGMTAITALTAQSTTGVTAIHPVPPEFIIEQVRVVAEDIGVDAVKIGMLGTAETVRAVRQALAAAGRRADRDRPGDGRRVRRRPARRRSASSDRDGAVPAGHGDHPEPPRGARSLAQDADDIEQLARALHALGPKHVVITGGHRDVITDVFFDGTTFHEIPGERYADGAAHGSGCTHSSTLAAHLALGYTPLEAAQQAKRLASEAVRDGLREIGRGAGPVNVLGGAVTPLTDRRIGATDPSGRSSARDIMRP